MNALEVAGIITMIICGLAFAGLLVVCAIILWHEHRSEEQSR